MAKKREPDKLSKEVSQAIAAGMSYGKWKAMQVPVEIPQKPPKECFTTQVCENCGCEFVQYSRRKRKYCGDRCMEQAYQRSRRAREKNTLPMADIIYT